MMRANSNISLLLLVCGFAGFNLLGCQAMSTKPMALPSPYPTRQVWAVAPLRNESGTLQADSLRFADKLAEQIEQVQGVSVLPVNRTLAAMEQLQIREITSPAQVVALQRLLAADALVIGSISGYDSYDPPKVGLIVELHRVIRTPAIGDLQQVRRFAVSASAKGNTLDANGISPRPISVVSHFYDAADPHTRDELQRFADRRGGEDNDPATWRLYRIDMDRYETFTCYATVARLIDQEWRRLHGRPLPTKLERS